MTHRTSVPGALLAQFNDFVSVHMGIHFPPERWPDLERGVQTAAREFGFRDEQSCLHWLMSAPLTKLQIEVLAASLTVGETYFFREKRCFEVLEQRILPDLVRERREHGKRLRLWSAACCTGEEAYSLAILLRRVIPDLQAWNVAILATDINPHFLHKAALGVFGEWSFRDAPTWLKDLYFTRPVANRYEILPEIRRMVTFSHLNLVQDVYPSLLTDTNAMDVILCRNVLMYFAPQYAQRAITNLCHCLVGHGWLILSACEAPDIPPAYTRLDMDGVIVYRKKDSAPPLDSAEQPPAGEPLAVHFPTYVEPPPPPTQATIASVAVPRADAGAGLLSEATAEAIALYAQGDYRGAADRLQQLALHSPDPPVIALLARCLANQGQLADALGWCDRLIAAEKLNPSAHYLRATILQEQGAQEEAIRALQRALFLDANFVVAHFALGNLARAHGKPGEAARHFRNALRLLRTKQPDDILPESDGIVAGRLAEIITALMEEVPAA